MHHTGRGRLENFRGGNRRISPTVWKRGSPIGLATAPPSFRPICPAPSRVRAAGDPGAPAARRLPQSVRWNHMAGSSRAGAPWGRRMAALIRCWWGQHSTSPGGWPDGRKGVL